MSDSLPSASPPCRAAPTPTLIEHPHIDPTNPSIVTQPAPRSLVCDVELHERGTRLTLRSMLSLVNLTQRTLAIDLATLGSPLLHLGILAAQGSLPIPESQLSGGLRLTDLGRFPPGVEPSQLQVPSPVLTLLHPPPPLLHTHCCSSPPAHTLLQLPSPSFTHDGALLSALPSLPQAFLNQRLRASRHHRSPPRLKRPMLLRQVVPSSGPSSGSLL